MMFAAEDQVRAVPHAIAIAETAFLIASSIAISGAAALDPNLNASDSLPSAPTALVAGKLRAADPLANISRIVGGVFTAFAAPAHFGDEDE